MLGEGEFAFFGMFGIFVVMVLLGIASNLHMLPSVF